jgi:signal transduction histidine kinase/CheY-like chemotaxis protein
VCALFAFLVVGLLIHRQYQQTLEEWKSRLSSIADGEELFVRTWVYERNGDLTVLSTRPLIATALLPNSRDGALRRGDIAQRTAEFEGEIAQPLLDKVVGAYGYAAIYLVDRTGTVKLNSTGAVNLPPALVKDASTATDVRFEALSQPLANALGARMALVSPVRDGVLHRDFRPGVGDLLGGIVILTKAELIYSLPSLGTASTRTGESILIRREGNAAVFLSSLRHAASIPLDQRDSLKPSAFASSSVLEGRTGFSQFKDYRGVSVLGVTRVIPNVDWGLITKIDRQEAFQNFYSLAGLELAATTIVLIVVVAIFFKAWRDGQVRGLQEEISRRRRVEEELRRINRALVTLSNCNQALLHAATESDLLHEICRVIVRDGGYRMAWVGFAEHDPAKTVRVAAVEGHEEGYLRSLNITWADMERGRGPTGTAIRTGRPAVCRDVLTDKDFALWRDAAIAHGYRSSAVLPLVCNGIVVGALTIYSGEVEAFDSGELELLATLGDNLSYGIEMLRLAEEKRRSDDALREAEARLRESQKMEALGKLAGGVAHDFNNLLSVIIGYSELMTTDPAPDVTASRRIGAIRRSAERAASLTAQLLAFSRRQLLQPRVINLNSLLADTEAILQRLIGEDIDTEKVLFSELARVKVDPAQMVQVIINLVVNARDAMPEGGKLTIETANANLEEGTMSQGVPVQPGPYVMLAVSDSGTGMDALTKARIFEPFFTTKPVGKGTGLGLATVCGIIQQSKGYIFVETEVGKGTTFRIYLPRVEEEVEEPSLQRALPQPARASETILLVEDEEPFRELLIEHLKDNGYTILAASNGVEALRVAKQHKGQIHLLITDVIMPQMSGPALVRSLVALRPHMKVLYMTGYTDDKLRDTAMSDPEVALLQKPFQLSDLIRKVRDVLDRSETPRYLPATRN